MGYLGLSNAILLVVTVVIIYFSWSYFKNIVRKDKVSVSVYVFLLGIAPLASLFLMYNIITTSWLDFYGYILLILLAFCVFLSTWIFTALYGEFKKVELSMYIVVGAITIIFMALMGLVEVLPNDILEFYLHPIVSMRNQYDIWSRPPYQLAHFLTFVITFPYIASFFIGRVILNYRRYKGVIDTELKLYT